MIAELRARMGQELESVSAELAGRLAPRPETDPDAGAPLADEAGVAQLQGRLAMLGQLVAGLAQVDPSTLWPDRAGFGSVVRVRELATGEEWSFTLMTGELVDPDQGQVSLASPIGHAIVGRAPGDQVAVATPRGERRFELLSVITLAQRVGLAEALRPARVA